MGHPIEHAAASNEHNSLGYDVDCVSRENGRSGREARRDVCDSDLQAGACAALVGLVDFD